MKKTLSTDEIAEALLADKYASWTGAGAYALAEYLQELEEDTGEEIELDVVEIRCDCSEYADLEDFLSTYFVDNTDAANDAIGATGDEDEDERKELIRDYIQERGGLIEFECGVIVSGF